MSSELPVDEARRVAAAIDPLVNVYSNNLWITICFQTTRQLITFSQTPFHRKYAKLLMIKALDSIDSAR